MTTLIFGTNTSSTRQDISLLIGRIALGIVLIAHGWQKFFTFVISGATASFEQMGIPLAGAAAVFAALVELVGGILLIVGLAVVLLLVTVFVPLARWRTTHYVVTTHRLLFREGILARRGRDLGLSRITDVSYTQSLWERIVRSGTLTIETAGEGGATVLARIPDSEGVQRLVNHMVEEDADRRAQESAGYLRGSWAGDEGDGGEGGRCPGELRAHADSFHGPPELGVPIGWRQYSYFIN